MRRVLGLITVVLMVGVVAVPALAGGGNEDNTNSVGYWCGSEKDGVKYDNLNQETFTVPAPPEGKVYTIGVIKAGSEQSVENPNHVVENPVEGDVLSHPSSKDISHVILCWEKEEEPTPGTGNVVGVCLPNGNPAFEWTLTGGSESSDALLTIEVALEFDSVDFTLFDGTLDADETASGVFGDDPAEASALDSGSFVRFRGNIGDTQLFDDHGDLGFYRDFDIPECDEPELIETSVSISGECRLVDGEPQGFIDAEVGEGTVLSIDGDPFGPGSYDDLTVVAPGTYPWVAEAAEGYELVGDTSGEVVIEDCSETTTTTTVPEETTTTEQETTTTTEASTTTTEADTTSTTKAPAPDGDAGNPLPWAIPVGAAAMLFSLFGLALRGRTE